MLNIGWKIALTALIVAASVGTAFAVAEISTIEVAPAPRQVSGFSNLVVPINGDGLQADGGRASFSIEFVETVDVQVKVGDNVLPFPEAGTAAEDVDSVQFAVGKDFGAIQDEKNIVKVFSRPAGSTASFSTPVTQYTVFVDRVKPSAPGSISAEGADQTVLVTWSPPGKTGTEFFDKYIITYHTEDFAGLTTQEVLALPTDTVGADDTKAVLSGLRNGVEYFVTVRTVDWVGNVSDFPKNADGSILTATAEPVITVSLAELAGEEGGCFIATAAYGSYHERHVRILRDFRDQVLLQTDLGSSFVAWYYRSSPPLAAWLITHEWARYVVRMALWPLYAVAYILLHPAVLLFMLPASAYVMRRRRLLAEVSS